VSRRSRSLAAGIGRFCEASWSAGVLSNYIEVVKRFDNILNVRRFVSGHDEKERGIFTDSFVLRVPNRQLCAAVRSAALADNLDVAILRPRGNQLDVLFTSPASASFSAMRRIRSSISAVSYDAASASSSSPRSSSASATSPAWPSLRTMLYPSRSSTVSMTALRAVSCAGALMKVRPSARTSSYSLNDSRMILWQLPSAHSQMNGIFLSGRSSPCRSAASSICSLAARKRAWF